MVLDDLMSVSGLPGLFKMTANRPNGLIVEDIESGKRRFCSVRKHQFTPLGSIAIYTTTDTVALKEVFKTMRDKIAELPLPDPKADKNELTQYFLEIVPQFDREKVYTSDIKKLVKWYVFLSAHELLEGALADEEKQATAVSAKASEEEE